MKRISDKMFIRELQILFKEWDKERGEFFDMIRKFYDGERAEKIIQCIQDPLEEV